jgi:transcriptional regulator with XRE-family HTH domain
MDVARLLGVKSASMISRWEQGLVIPDTNSLFDLSLIYCVPSDALFSDYRSWRNERIQERKEALNIQAHAYGQTN